MHKDMATFNFDSETNTSKQLKDTAEDIMKFLFDTKNYVPNEKIPSAKSINQNFCGVSDHAGIWISDESMISSGWENSCTQTCNKNCNLYFVNTKPHNVETPTSVISGRGVITSRICVLRHTELLKINTKGVVEGLWVKGDGEIKDKKEQKKYICARRYLLVFLDEYNMPLHERPIQLTAKGIFQIHFHKQLTKFRSQFQKVYKKEIPKGEMSDFWHTACVFTPVLKSELVGKSPYRSHACITYFTTTITKENWIHYCVGESPELMNLVYDLFMFEDD